MKTTTENTNAAVKPAAKADRKKIPSKLDPFTEELLRMDVEGKTLQKTVDWLRTQSVETSINNVSAFLISRRRQRAVTERLDGEKDVFETVQKWIEENPNPKLEAVIEMFKMLAMNLATTKEAVPELLQLADKLARTAVRFANDQSRSEYRTRKLVMEEENHAEAKQVRQARALELCLAKSKKYPEVAAAFQAAFDALDKAEGILA